MRKLLFLFFCLISVSVFCQDSLTISIKGKANESNLNEAISNTRFEVLISSTEYNLTKWVITNDRGEFQLKLSLPADKKLVSFDISSEKGGYKNHYIHSLALKGKDTSIHFPMNFIREKICRDVWLPKPVFFAHSKCDSTTDNFNDLKSMLLFYKDNPEILQKSKLVITAYNSFTEKTKTAVCRLNTIKKIIAESGIPESNVKFVSGGKTEFTYFYYHSGCHTEQEFKENIVLSKSSYKKASAEQKKEVEKLRRSVLFTWE